MQWQGGHTTKHPYITPDSGKTDKSPRRMKLVFTERTGVPATLASQLRAGISKASWCRGNLREPIPGPARPSPGQSGQGRGCVGMLPPGALRRDLGGRGPPAGSRRGDGGGGGGLHGGLGTRQVGKGHRGPHRGPRAVGRASPPSAGSAGPSRGCRRSGPPGRSRHISPPHPGSPPWLALSSVSSSGAATEDGSRGRDGGEPARGGGVRWRAGRRAEDRGGGPGGLAGSRLRLLTAASPPPAGRYNASRIPPGPRTELPGLDVGADSPVRALRRQARSRPTSGLGGEAGDTSPAARRGTAPR